MRRIVGYKTIANADLDKFDEDIIKNLKSGWELYGSPTSVVATPFDKYRAFVVQALVKYDSVENSDA